MIAPDRTLTLTLSRRRERGSEDGRGDRRTGEGIGGRERDKEDGRGDKEDGRGIRRDARS